MDFRPNVDAMAWFCEAVWPGLRALRPKARLAIVGRDPAPRVAALADPALGIEVSGAVEDVRPWIAEAGVVVVPLRVGGGTRLKVLEAMAMGKAVVATSLGVEGLDLQPGVEAEIVDDPAAMAASIARLMADPAARAALGRRARARALADYRWEVLVPRIEALYRAEEDPSHR
jgi:glycosyltransferase involved in cell wall biosynthesis